MLLLLVAVTPVHKKATAGHAKSKAKKKKDDKDESKPGKRKRVDTLVPRPQVTVLEKDPLLETRYVL